MSTSLKPHELQHTRLPCPSLSPGICSNSCPLRQLCQQSTVLFSVTPIPTCFQSYSALVLSNDLALCIRWPKHWRFSFSINPFNEYSGLISFRIDWFELLAVQGTLKSLLQHYSSKASILWSPVKADGLAQEQLSRMVIISFWKACKINFGKLKHVFTFAYMILYYLML